MHTNLDMHMQNVPSSKIGLASPFKEIWHKISLSYWFVKACCLSCNNWVFIHKGKFNTIRTLYDSPPTHHKNSNPEFSICKRMKLFVTNTSEHRTVWNFHISLGKLTTRSKVKADILQWKTYDVKNQKTCNIHH